MSLSKKIGWLLLGLLLLLGYLQPYIYPKDPAFQDFMNMLSPPSAEHWLGTDQYGRDMLARLAAAIRLSFSMIVLCVSCALISGALCGLLAGAFGGMIERILNFIADIIVALPGLLFVLLFAAIAPGTFWALYLGIALVMWVEFFRVVRAMSQQLARSPEIESSKLMGFGFFYCLRRHYLPRLLPVVLTLSAFSAGNAVLALATLGFISVGLRPPTAELGLMMTELFPYYREAPWVFMQPIIVVFCLVLSFQLISGQKNAANR